MRPRTSLGKAGARPWWMRPSPCYPATPHRATPDPVFFTADGRVAGRLTCWRGRLCLLKVVRASRHMLRRPPAWAVDEAVLAEAQAAGAEVVLVRDSESGAVYHAPLARFARDGFPLQRGHGRQRALPLAAWTVERRGQLFLLDVEETHECSNLAR